MKFLLFAFLSFTLQRVTANANASSITGIEATAGHSKTVSEVLVRAVLSVYQHFSTRVSKVIVIRECEASFCPTDEIFAVLQTLLSNSMYVTGNNVSIVIAPENLRRQKAASGGDDFGLGLGMSSEAETLVADGIAGGTLGFVIVSDGSTENAFISSLESLSSESLWDPEFFFVFVLVNPVVELSREMEDILRYAWENFEVLNCVLVYMQETSSSTPEKLLVKKFNPFEDGGKLKDISREAVSSCIFCRKPTNTQGFPLMISTAHFPPFLYIEQKPNGETSYSGPLYLMAESFARIFNFSLIASSNFVRNTSRWSIPKSYFNEPGYSANGYVLFRPEFLKVTTYPFSYDASAFVVPKAQQMPMWMNAILPFTLETWVAYVLFTTATSLACYFLSCCVFDSAVPNFQPLEMFRLFIVGASEHPLGSSSLRLFFTANVIFNIVFNNAYTGSFSSYIMVPQFFKDFASLEEAVAGSLRVAIAFNVASNNSISTTELATGADIDDPKTQLIMQNSFFVDTYASAVQMAKTARNVCVMSTGLVGLFDAYSRDNHDGNRPLLHVIPGGMMSLMYTYRTRPRFPFRSWLNAFVVGLQDLGFANKGRQELVSSIKSSSSFGDLGDGVIPLSLEHLQTYFYILAVGTCLSVLVFLWEAVSAPALHVYLHVGRRLRPEPPRRPDLT